MRLTKLSALAVVAISLMSTDSLALNRKFNPVVNDSPENSHWNVQTPGDDSNQTVLIKQEPGPDGQVIPAGDAKVAACAAKDANGDIDLSGGTTCPTFRATAPFAVRASVTAPAIGKAPSPRMAARIIHVPTSAPVARAASNTAQVSSQAVTTPSTTLAPARGTETVRAAVAIRPVRQPAIAARAHAIPTAYADMRWLEIGLFGFAAAILAAVGLALLFRLGLAGLLVRRDEPGEAAQDARIPAAVSARRPLP
ncbi:MAG TPA: hypothetical protein VKB71_02575 [Rhizomicrobium sp.]|nr:hypothetical protein [Rhizomicrobium sp.]